MTLKSAELDALIQYISENYKLLSLGQGKYTSVDSEKSELFEKIKSILEGSEETAKALIENVILATDVYYAADCINRKKFVGNFEEMLPKKLPKSDWQDWFQENK